MILAKKVRLHPTPEQEQQLWKSVGTARWAYNWALAKQVETYKNGGKFISDQDLRKELTVLKQTEEYTWLYEVSNNVTKQAIKDACEAFKKFFQKKKLRRKQRQVSRKYEQSKQETANEKGGNRYKFTKTKNIAKMEKEMKLIHRKLRNIRSNHIHQATAEIVKTKPSRIVVEDLNVRGMMKNQHLAKAIAEQGFHQFISILTYKCQRYGIELLKANRFYPSSKTCSVCAAVKKDLKLSDRVFICASCNCRIDRDLNAAINLSRYQQSA